MGVNIQIVAQRAEDQFYKQYKANSDFFEFEDFVARCGYVLSDYYFTIYREQYAELRALRSDELVMFDPLTLNEQIVSVQKEKSTGRLFATFDKPVMSFVYSNQSVGVQEVTVVEPAGDYGKEIERTPASWQLALMPFVDKIFFKPTKTGIDIFKKGNCNVAKVKILYVPSVNTDDYEVPDTLVELVIERAVQAMRESPIAVKKTNDQNQNVILETEINKNSLKQNG